MMPQNETPKETPKAAAAFQDYCLLGSSRSLAKLAQKLGKPSGYTRQLETWSSDYHWVKRVAAYDAEQRTERERKNQEALEQMNERHAVMGQANALQAVKQIDTLVKAKSFGSQAAVQLFKVSTDLERIARGAATERKELTGKDGEPLEAPTRGKIMIDVTQLTNTQLAALVAILDEVEGVEDGSSEEED